MVSRNQRWLRRALLPAVSVQRRLVDARFVRTQGLELSPASKILGPPMVLAGRIRRVLRSAYDDEVLARYVSRHSLHYGPRGRGYASVRNLSRKEAEGKYSQLISRVEFFLDTYPDLMDYKDGNSFVDLGCGMGQNIRMLSKRFPNSSITGFDISVDAINVIQVAERNPRVVSRVGNVLDSQVLSDLRASRPDHIILSHVLSLLIAPTAVETRKLRKMLVTNLVDACQKSVIILDGFSSQKRLEVSVEQFNRAIVLDDTLEYVWSIPGIRALRVRSDLTEAIICQRRNGI